MSQTQTRCVRLAISEVLAKHSIDDVVLEMDLTVAVTDALEERDSRTGEKLTPDILNQRTIEAMGRGVQKDLELKDEWFRYFRTEPNWKTKTASAFALWYKSERNPDQTLERFATWWWRNDWRGKDNQPPTIPQVRELWAQAFTTPTHQSGRLLVDI